MRPGTPLRETALQHNNSLWCRLFSSQAPITATLFPGDGIGPEIAEAVKKIFKAADAPIVWDEQHISQTADPRTNSFITRENLDSVLVRCSCVRQVKLGDIKLSFPHLSSQAGNALSCIPSYVAQINWHAMQVHELACLQTS